MPLNDDNDPIPDFFPGHQLKAVGDRPGPGRKRLDPSGPLDVVPVRLTAQQKATHAALGGAGGYRQYLTDVDAALRALEQLEGWAKNSLWIAPDASGNAAIWRLRGAGALLHCVGDVYGEQFAGLVAAAFVARVAATESHGC
jgi:hypothetical protein